MPQLDLFAYTTLICAFGVFFFFFILLCYLFFFSLGARVAYSRAFFSVSDIFQFVGGAYYLQGLVFFLLSREFNLYRFTMFVSQRM